ncbi:MAG: dihydroorotase [Betaproteobacteria bacterium]|nr:MAG: dihydroorotase [Betaproteobacteria bacterium]
MKIEINHGRLIDPKHGVDRPASLFIAAGKIAAIGDAPPGWHANRVIDAAGLIVCPGFIDACARLREPGFEYKATLESEMQAAIAGGVTSLACPPDTDPPLDEPGLVEMLKHRARSLSCTHVYPVGALTVGLKGETLTEMGELVDAGCIAFSQADAPLADNQVLWRAMQYAATFGYRVWLRPQDAFLARGGVAHDGEVAMRLGLATIPSASETIALDAIFALARTTGAQVHLARLSTHEGVDRIREAKRKGLPITCDVAINHLHLCDVDLGWFNPHCRLIPPLRGVRDREALRKGLADGTIDAICSDHTPVDDDGKQVPFAEAEPGATGLELLLPLTLKWAHEEKFALAAALCKLTVDPARVLGIDAGHIAVGAQADVCVFDPDAYWLVEPRALKSQGKNTPFLGLELPGKVRYTLVGGQVVHEA